MEGGYDSGFPETDQEETHEQEQKEPTIVKGNDTEKTVYKAPNATKTSKKLYALKKEKIKESRTSSGLNNDEEVLLLNAPKDTDHIFRELGIPSQKAFVNEQLKDVRILNRYEELFPGCEAFKGKHIKELCNKYFLQIMPLNELGAFLDEEAASFIAKFVKNFDTILNGSSFYILAPREYFTPDFHGKQAITFIIFFRDGNDSSSKDYAKVAKNDTLVQLYSSGKDFKSVRKYKKYVDKTTYKEEVPSKFWGNILICLFLLAALICIPFGYFWVSTTCTVIFLFWIIIDNLTFMSDSFWNEKCDL